MIFLAFLIPFTIGLFFLTNILQRRHSETGLYLITSFPIGLGMISTFLFWSYFLANNKGIQLTHSLSFLFILCSILINHQAIYSTLTQKHNANQKRLVNNPTVKAITALSLLVLVYASLNYWNFFWTWIEKNPLGGWDGRYFWNLKARLFFRDPNEWKAMFSPVLKAWAHPDYPILIPGAVAWGWFILGNELILWPALVSFMYPLCICLLVFWYLKRRTSTFVAALAVAYLTSIETFRFWATTQYNDVPLAFYFLTAYIFFTFGLEKKSPSYFFISGCCLGMSIWTKDEGYLFTVLIFGVTFLLCFCKNLDYKFKIRMLLYLLIGCFLFGIASIVVKSYLGTSGGQFVGSGRSMKDYMHLLFGSIERTRFITKAFEIYLTNFTNWNGLWILFLLALLFANKKLFKNPLWILPSLVIGQLLGYFVIMHITKVDLKWQIETALTRLILQISPLALVFTFEVFGNVPLTESQKESLSGNC